MKIEKHVIKKYTLELTEQEMDDLVRILKLYCMMYGETLLDDELIDEIVIQSNEIGNITARSLIDGFTL